MLQLEWAAKGARGAENRLAVVPDARETYNQIFRLTQL